MEIIDCKSAKTTALSQTQLEAVVTAINTNQPIVFPTDTVYGIAGNPGSKEAIETLLAAKGRGRQKPPPILLANAQQVTKIAKDVPAAAYRLMEAFWPGALTLILKSGEEVKYDLGDMPDTVAVRMPDNPIALQILAKTGPLAVTSANLTGAPAATDCPQAVTYFADKVAVYVDGGATEGNLPSTIVSCVDEVKILRRGKITDTEIFEVLHA
ncbi:L-threonylcarbamoyladenylate synthase [Gleimia sp. 6138-11-ORH1]|uniref:L-threonylcarbamoyladenylate synthase n=1 Tax=Gleimia sp. 6138-11-ORH1 TaxID=2973937 RepID=UPI0021697F9A|nr:L-threonylcarbamoyladenylate synthase [Gleimia sp. 6138-11-ORH1]MCS4484091.1 L-threonylcarbamoyladenylate synthase [Gleimia sp. 6138-11-ORH1]